MNDASNAAATGITVVAFITVLALVVVSSFWVKRDSALNRVPIDSKPYSTNNGAWAWFGSCVLLWIVAFPYYFYRRSVVLRERRQTAAPPIAPAAASMPDVEQELRKLARLKQEGLISDADYDVKKKQLLGV